MRIPRALGGHVPMQIRHNPVVWRSPSFVGAIVSRKGHTTLIDETKAGFSTMWLRLGSALAGAAACATACVVLWPHARDAGAVLAAQDDPVELADLQLNSALRDDQGAIERNIEAALAAGDADLAKSFVDLAAAKDVVISGELSRRVTEAVAEQNSTSHFSKPFPTALVTGNADDVASMSGTVAGDLFVVGDIRDVVREGKHR